MSASTPKARLKWKRWLAVVLLVPVLVFASYMFFVLSWTYSAGERAGYVQKFSRKGFVFKTWEGELAMVALPGTTPEKFYFTVRDDGIAARINAELGKRVVLAYKQHIGIPTTAFGETSFFVDNIRVAE